MDWLFGISYQGEPHRDVPYGVGRGAFLAGSNHWHERVKQRQIRILPMEHPNSGKDVEKYEAAGAQRDGSVSNPDCFWTSTISS